MDTTPKASCTHPWGEDAAEIERRVWCKVRGMVRELQLEMADQGIILRGRALTFYAKQLAQEAVMKVTGLPIAANCIDVE